MGCMSSKPSTSATDMAEQPRTDPSAEATTTENGHALTSEEAGASNPAGKDVQSPTLNKTKPKVSEQVLNYPQSAWIVIFIGKHQRAGKLVLALKGKSVYAAVQRFEELYKEADLNPKTLSTEDTEIPLVLTTEKSKAWDTKTELYGVIEEGAEALEMIRNAPPDARVFIRQAAVYPVKIAKSR